MLILPISGSMTTVTWISYTDFDVPFEVWRTAFQGIGVVSEVWRIRSGLKVDAASSPWSAYWRQLLASHPRVDFLPLA